MKYGDHRRPLRSEDADDLLSQQLLEDASHMDIGLMQDCIDMLYPDIAEECAADWEALQALNQAVQGRPSRLKRGHFRSHYSRMALLIAAIFLLVTLFATAIASKLGVPWVLDFVWLPDRLTILADLYSTYEDDGRDQLIVPAEDDFGDALRRHQINHRFPPVPEGWKLVELIDHVDNPYMSSLDAMYKKEGVNFGLSYTIILPDRLHQNSTGMLNFFKDPGDPIVDSYDGYDFYFYQDESYGNILVNYGDCLFQFSSPASLDELRETIRQLYEGD